MRRLRVIEGLLRVVPQTRIRLLLKTYYVYILSSRQRTLYTGVTGDLPRRVQEHRLKLVEGFTKRYNVTQLVYFESTTDVLAAIAREKQIKRWSRSKKIALVRSMNPEWKDLAVECCGP